MSFLLRAFSRSSRLAPLLLLLAVVDPLKTGSNRTQTLAADVLNASDDGELILRGQVLLADGSPAANATVSSLDQWSRSEVTVTADEGGRFELVDDFGSDCRIHAKSADGRHQATWRVPAMSARTRFAKPVEVELQPSVEHLVSVEANGEPVEGVYVLAVGEGTNYRVTGVTGADGTVRLRLPANERLDRISAWHPQRGVSGKPFADGVQLPESTELALLPPISHTVRMTDPSGHPVPNLLVGISVRTEATDYILTRDLPEARLRSGADGMVTFPWFPPEFRHVDVDLFDDGWKVDEIKQADAQNPMTTVTVRRKRTVHGRLVMPAGSSAEGLLIQASSFGPGHRSDSPEVRANSDGTFSIPVCSDHVYFLNVVDMEWASDGWRGVILATDDSEPADISIPVYPATQVDIRVTRGPSRRPVTNQSVHLSGSQRVEWRDAGGEKRSGVSGIHQWVMLDADGVARLGLGRGLYHARLGGGDWEERQTFEVRSSQPQTVDFHRAWERERTVACRLVDSEGPAKPTPSARIQAWGINPTAVASRPSAVEPAVEADGAFRVAFDAEEIFVFVHEPDKEFSGIATAGPKDKELDVSLTKNGTFGGRLVDREGEPLVGFEIGLELVTDRKVRWPTGDGHFIVVRRGPEIPVAENQTTDSNGRFQFSNVPAEMPLTVRVIKTDGPTGYVYRPDQILLEAGEARNDGVVIFRYHNRSNEESVRLDPPRPLAERIGQLVRDAEINRMHVLVVLCGDESPPVLALGQEAINYDENRDVLKYLTIGLDVEEQQRDAQYIAERKWPEPGGGHVVLVALNGRGEVLGTTELAAHDDISQKESIRSTAEFVRRHAPAVRDAREAFREAQELAARTDRRIWLISGGPRCGPCFALARWMDEHHQLLEKDYVICKVGICDTGSGEVMRPYQPDGGIPWHVIVEPDGTKLVTSNGPLGNIGFPSGHESLRHFREMLDQTAVRLVPDEKEQLLRSLKADE